MARGESSPRLLSLLLLLVRDEGTREACVYGVPSRGNVKEGLPKLSAGLEAPDAEETLRQQSPGDSSISSVVDLFP